jgi:uncharacterized protein YndB with AHSA1/START domain
VAREFEIRKEIEVAASPEQVWDAIATGPGITAWFMPHEVEPGEGGTIRLAVEGHRDEGTITVWEPAKRLAYRGQPAEDGTVHAMEFLIEGRAGGSTVLRFVHSGMLGDNWDDDYQASTDHGWDMYLHTLAEYLTHFAGRPVTYVHASGPAASAKDDAWAVLWSGLGLDGSVAVGDRVRLTPEGFAPLEGVVDYLGPEFLGVRTTDGLYRFHGLARLGCPIAVGHHVFAEVDEAGLERDWTGWLHGLFR